MCEIHTIAKHSGTPLVHFHHTIKQYTIRLFSPTLNSCPVRLKHVSMNRVSNETHVSLDISTSLQCQQAPDIIRTVLA